MQPFTFTEGNITGSLQHYQKAENLYQMKANYLPKIHMY